MNEVITKLKTYLTSEDVVIVGVSGGPDSMCLLSLLMGLNVKIVCAHINHQIRKESEEEYNYVKSYCKKHNILFEGTNMNLTSFRNFESEARKFRYEFFEKLAYKHQAKYILTAHHGDDLIETILMRITRGSNLRGYAGIKELDGKYLRPLLSVTKEEIMDYLDKEHIKYYWDYTNDEDEHMRNRYRHNVVKFLKRENPQVHLKYLQFSNNLIEYENFILDELAKSKIINEGEIEIEKFKSAPKLLQKKAVEVLIKKIQVDNWFEVSNNLSTSIINFIMQPKVNATIDLPNGFIGVKNYNKFLISQRKTNNEPYKTIFNKTFENEGFIIKKVSSCDEKSNFVIRLDSSEFQMPLKIRTRHDGDVMEVKNSGHKKIKDIFIDSKVDHDSRMAWPLLVDSADNIIWLPGLKKSKFDKEKTEKYDIILLCERKR